LIKEIINFPDVGCGFIATFHAAGSMKVLVLPTFRHHIPLLQLDDDMDGPKLTAANDV
jgi:hypothetical protein